MLLIRKEQMDTFNRYMLHQFEELQMVHLNRHYPRKCQAMGEGNVRKTIRYGIKRAEIYDVRIEFDVSRYINIMFSFGFDFDADPTLPWASAILKDAKRSSGTAKMDQLYQEAAKHLNPAVGIHNEQKEVRP